MTRSKTFESLTVGAAVAAVLLPAALAGAQECFPPCRSGYACQAGTCVAATPTTPQVVTTPVVPGPQTGTPAGGPSGGGPAWGAGSGAAGGAAWSPRTAPPTPLTDEEIERRALRTRMRFVVYAMGGAYPQEEYDTSTGSGGELALSGDAVSLGGGFGLGLRANFTRAFGLQARALMSFDTASLKAGDLNLSESSWDTQLMGIDVILEIGLRFGPVADSVPWYFGVFAGAGDRFLIGDALCVVHSGTICHDLFGGGDHPDGAVVDLARSFVGLDVGFETGFVFGSREQFDVGLRFNTLTDANGTWQMGLLLMFGLALI